MRTGEKLYEEVFSSHKDGNETEHPKISRALAELLDDSVDRCVYQLVRMAMLDPQDEAKLRAMIGGLVPDFAVQPKSPEVLVLRPRESDEHRDR